MQVNEWLDTQLGVDIWEKKYRHNGESFDAWLDRVSGNDSNIRQLIIEKKWLPAGRILAGRGLSSEGRKITYSNCYVLEPPADNIESIFKTASEMARTFSYGGGVGIDISKLSPRGAFIRNSAEATTGAVSFMSLYNMVTELIGQKGRRGALMLSIDCHHPDLMEFITVKSDLTQVTSANISVRFDNSFMRAVKENRIVKQSFTRPETGQTIELEIDAYEVFKKFAENNWNFAEPGALFWDRIKDWNLLSEVPAFSYAGVNPCAEEPLPAYGSCLLSAINLAEFVNQYGDFQEPEFERVVRLAVVEMNRILDEGAGLHPLEEQRKNALDWRQIGIGIMGFADMLIKMGIEYGSTECLHKIEYIGTILMETAIQESAGLSEKYGPFPKYTNEILYSEYLQRAEEGIVDFVAEHGLRNSQLLTIAPTGSISTMLNVSGGIEPVFDSHFTRTVKSFGENDIVYDVFNPLWEEVLPTQKEKDAFKRDELKLSSSYITAKEINWERRLLVQSEWQEYIDASISSTLNLPESTSIEEVITIYLRAWELGLKGITIFRENCARTGILYSVKDKEAQEDVEQLEELKRGAWANVAEDTIYYPQKIYIGCGKLKLFIGYSPSLQKIQDFYVVRSGNGGCERNLQAMVIAMSGMLRLGGDLTNIEKAFEGLGVCPAFVASRAKGEKVSAGVSCGTAILKAIKEFLASINSNTVKLEKPLQPLLTPIIPQVKNECPSCGTEIRMQEGCMTCPSCGYSKCS